MALGENAFAHGLQDFLLRGTAVQRPGELDFHRAVRNLDSRRKDGVLLAVHLEGAHGNFQRLALVGIGDDVLGTGIVHHPLVFSGFGAGDGDGAI